MPLIKSYEDFKFFRSRFLRANTYWENEAKKDALTL